MAAKQLSDQGPDGTKLGQSAADLIGFYGTTAAAQPAATAQSAIATTALTALTSGETLLGVISMANIIITRLAANTTLNNQTRSDLVTLGLLKGSL
jgi:hypothetical protein